MPLTVVSNPTSLPPPAMPAKRKRSGTADTGAGPASRSGKEPGGPVVAIVFGDSCPATRFECVAAIHGICDTVGTVDSSEALAFARALEQFAHASVGGRSLPYKQLMSSLFCLLSREHALCGAPVESVLATHRRLRADSLVDARERERCVVLEGVRKILSIEGDYERGAIRCRRCGGTDIRVKLTQVRGGDEPMRQEFTCGTSQCGATWSVQ